jgi:hypothetical protein
MAYVWHINPLELKTKSLDELVELSEQTEHIADLIREGKMNYGR